jgi:hypothetical protein
MTNPVFQTQAKPTLKPTYQFASTQELIGSLQGSGWYPVETKVAAARSKSNAGFQRHIVQLHNDSFPEIPGMTGENKSRVQIAVMNSHDGSTALRMMLGFLRFACLNGVIAGTGLREFRAIHTGSLRDKLAVGVEYMTGGIDDLVKTMQHLQGTTFSKENLDVLVKTLVDERLRNANVVEGSVDYGSALQVRRNQDTNEDAFTVFNRLQESLMRGGIHYRAVRRTLDLDGKVVSEEVRNATTRKLSSIPQAVRLNTLAYDLAVKLAA